MYTAESEFPLLKAVDYHYFFKEQLVFFYFNLIKKSNPKNVLELSNKLFDVLTILKKQLVYKQKEYLSYLVLFYRMIGQTRDIFLGKGEHDISYLLLYVFYGFYPEMAERCLSYFLFPLENNHSQGSWRDIKYLCEYIKKQSSEGENHPLIHYCIALVNKRLQQDVLLCDVVFTPLNIYNETPEGRPNRDLRATLPINELKGKPPTEVCPILNLHRCKERDFSKVTREDVRRKISNVSKWIPRENKRFDWLFEKLAVQWVTKFRPYLLTTAKDYNSHCAALRKAKMKYRKIVSFLNALLETTEIRICAKKWNTILPTLVPQIAASKYKNSLCEYVFREPDAILGEMFYKNIDIQKLECSLKFRAFYDEKFNVGGVFDPHRPSSDYIPFPLPLSHYIKEAFSIIKHGSSLSRKKLLNNQWEHMSSVLGNTPLVDTIPVLDLSFYCDKYQSESYYSAIGLACLIAERSTLEKRILVIDHLPTWINLENDKDLFSMVSKISDGILSNSFTRSDFRAGMKFLMDGMIEGGLSNTKIRDVTIVYLQTVPNTIHHETLIQLFYKGGASKRPLPCPKILYWNLSQETVKELPGPTTSKNCFFLSGLSATMISYLYLLRTSVCASDFILHILDAISFSKD
jgi:hypothetical protein